MTDQKVTKSNVACIREYFGKGENGRLVEMAELRALSMDEREELGNLARIELEN